MSALGRADGGWTNARGGGGSGMLGEGLRYRGGGDFSVSIVSYGLERAVLVPGVKSAAVK